MFSKVWRYGLILAMLLSLYGPLLESRPKTDASLSGWSAPAPLFFETAKPRTTAQTSGTFFTPALTVRLSFEGRILFVSLITLFTLVVFGCNLSQLQRWQI